MQATHDTGNTWAPESLRHNWGWMLALGILMLLLGMAGLFMVTMYTLAGVTAFGALLVVGGIVHLGAVLRAKGWKSITLHVLIALVYIAGGVLTLINPVIASLSLTLVIAAMLLAVGIMRSVMAFQMRPVTGWGWVLFGGIVSVLLGIAIAIQWPVSGLFAIGLFIAIELIANGWSCIWIALAARIPGSSGQSKPQPE